MKSYVDQIRSDEITFEATFSRGPGGQSVNRTSSAVILRWSPYTTGSFTEDEKRRLIHQLAKRLTVEGEIIVRSETHRSQDMNKKECLEKLNAILQQAFFIPKKRKKTRPTKGSVERRHQTKKRRSEVKQMRRKVHDA